MFKFINYQNINETNVTIENESEFNEELLF